MKFLLVLLKFTSPLLVGNIAIMLQQTTLTSLTKPTVESSLLSSEYKTVKRRLNAAAPTGGCGSDEVVDISRSLDSENKRWSSRPTPRKQAASYQTAMKGDASGERANAWLRRNKTDPSNPCENTGKASAFTKGIRVLRLPVLSLCLMF